LFERKKQSFFFFLDAFWKKKAEENSWKVFKGRFKTKGALRQKAPVIGPSFSP